MHFFGIFWFFWPQMVYRASLIMLSGLFLDLGLGELPSDTVLVKHILCYSGVGASTGSGFMPLHLYQMLMLPACFNEVHKKTIWSPRGHLFAWWDVTLILYIYIYILIDGFLRLYALLLLFYSLWLTLLIQGCWFLRLYSIHWTLLV